MNLEDMSEIEQCNLKITCFVIGPANKCILEYENMVYSYLELHLDSKYYGKIE